MKQKTYLVRVRGTELWIKILKFDLNRLREYYHVSEEEHVNGEIYVEVDLETSWPPPSHARETD
jgi:hypothetical protein